MVAPVLRGGMRDLWILSCRMWDLVLWPGIEPGSPALGTQSVNHWTTRKVPDHSLRLLWESCYEHSYNSFCEHTFLLLVGAELLSYRVTVWLMLKEVTKLYPQVAVCSHQERTRVPIFPQPCQLLVLLVFFILAALVRCAVVCHWSTLMPTSLTSSGTAALAPTFFPSLPDHLSVSPMFWAFFLEFSSSQNFHNEFLFMIQFSAQVSPPQRPFLATLSIGVLNIFDHITVFLPL